MKIYLSMLLVLSSCAHATNRGITYLSVENSDVDVDAIDPNQIDAAWSASVRLWGLGDPARVTVRFWSTPIIYGNRMLAGATSYTEINVYLKPGDEACLFRVGNEGALVHEMGHALQWEHGRINDPNHMAPEWQDVGGVRESLDERWCTEPLHLDAFLRH